MATFSLVVLTALYSFCLSDAACPSHCKAGQICDAADSGCPECEQPYYGRTCQHRLECRISTKGSEYRGKRNTTLSGRTCQRWDSKTPHTHKYSGLEENYCRNTDNYLEPWCYTIDPGKRYEVCGVPSCSNQCLAPSLNSSGVDIVNPPPDGFAVGFYAVVGCMTGYEALGQPAVTTLQCGNDKTWTQSPLPTCNKVQCSSFTRAHISITNPQPKYEYQDSITIACNSGYTLQGQNTLTCQADKSWGPSLSNCNVNECSTPGSIPNGFTVGRKATYVYQDTVSIMCNIGFVLNGTGIITCQADKTWSSSPVCEKACPSNCEAGKTCDGADSGCPECQRAYYGRQCQHRLECRFSEKGSEYRGKRNTTVSGKTCQRWDSQTPHSHSQNSAELEENYCRNPGSELGIWCYTTDENKRWEFCGVPFCSDQCLSPPLKGPGVVIINPPSEGFAVGFSATIRCMTGYETSGQPATVSVTCQNDKSWTQSSLLTCNKVQCRSPTPNPNSKVAYPQSNYEYQDKISIVCDTGYYLQGQSTLTCQANKFWNSSLPTCNKVQCPSPIPTTHSQISNPQSKYQYLDSITIACDTGYTMRGEETVVCEADTSWRPSFPACNKVQCSSPVTTPNSRIMNPQPQYLYQQSISIVCDAGYTLQGQSTLTCQADKTWSHSLPTCSIQCPAPATTPNSRIVNPQPQYLYQQSISIVCDTGYTLQGQSILTCQADKSWSHSLPTCSINECPEPKALNSSIVGTKAKYEYQDTVTIKCNTGYTLKGVEKMTCQADKTWSTAPTCEIIECPEPKKIINSSIAKTKTKYVYQDTVTIKCNTGHTLKGMEKMTCQANKTWTSSPTCEINECAGPVNISNGSILETKAKYEYQDILTIKCNTGYTRQGQEKMTCQANETWSDAPICAINECPDPITVPDSSMLGTKAKYVYQDTVIIKCNPRYTLKGEEKMQCLANKTWSDAPSCESNNCDPPKLSNNSKMTVTKTTFQHGDVVEFLCADGFIIQGPTQLTCLGNRTWDMQPPFCKIIECTLPSLPATIELQNPKHTYFYGDLITFSCTEGHEFHRGNTSVCTATAQWSEPFPFCKKLNCIDLKLSSNVISNPKKYSYSYNDKVSFHCKDGFKLSHDNDLVCQANKLWDKEEPFCIEICSGLSTPQWAGITVGSNLANTLLTFVVAILFMRRFRPKHKGNERPPSNAIKTTNAAFDNYDSIDVNTKDEQHIYNLPE